MSNESNEIIDVFEVKGTGSPITIDTMSNNISGFAIELEDAVG